MVLPVKDDDHVIINNGEIEDGSSKSVYKSICDYIDGFYRVDIGINILKMLLASSPVLFC
jgi:hypothetical protein